LGSLNSKQRISIVFSVQLEDGEIEALESEAREGETLSQTILRMSHESAAQRNSKRQREDAAH
jgi:hypothetical protein